GRDTEATGRGCPDFSSFPHSRSVTISFVIAPERPPMHEHGSTVLIIGAGVIGLFSALCLRRRRFRVIVFADHFAPRVTSNVAGALWEWPPAVCGRHREDPSLARAKGWCEASYKVFADLARDSRTGVYLRPVTFYFKRPIHEDPPQREKMAELSGK